jgi:hypothetical protein
MLRIMGEQSSFDVLKTYLEARASFTAEELAFAADYGLAATAFWAARMPVVNRRRHAESAPVVPEFRRGCLSLGKGGGGND